MSYIIGIDQSTQGTKAVLVDQQGRISGRADRKHRQIINDQGWVSHDLLEVYQNTVQAVKDVIAKSHIEREQVVGIGISNQRETTAAWREDGTPLGYAVVWQCDRAKTIVRRLKDKAEQIQEKTGLPLSPYFPAAKMAWLLENQAEETDNILLGTIDSWLIYKLTGGKAHKTDYSNASRTQLYNLHTLKWDQELCDIFGIPSEALPEVCDSNSNFGSTTMEGFFEQPIPICGVLGDSHAALYAQGCHEEGMVKVTYGTGSSIMMNVGAEFKKSDCGLATSLAWGLDGHVSYVLEGNINYTGAVVSWLAEELGLIGSMAELDDLLSKANSKDETVLVPAFTGLSAPYWDDDARAVFYGMSRTTGRAELVKAATESIAFQITDVVRAMERDSGIRLEELKVDGGPTRNQYLMQFQSDLTGIAVSVPKMEEFSALGAAYMAGIKLGCFQKEQLFDRVERTIYTSRMGVNTREQKYRQWKQAVAASRYRETEASV